MRFERDPERPDPAEPSRQRVRETLIERQIREAMDDGRFDDLPYQGTRLPLEDDSAAGDRAMAYRMLRDAGVAPGWIEADKTVRTLLEQRDRLLAQVPRMSTLGRIRARDDLRRLVGATNRAILRVNIEAPTDRQHRRPLDVEIELARLDAAARKETPSTGQAGGVSGRRGPSASR